MGKDSMNIVTIKAKAQLAAMKLCSSRNDMAKTADIIESWFAPDLANDKGLLEALQALKTLRDTICNSVIPLSGKTGVVSSCIYEAGKILKKYPNLI